MKIREAARKVGKGALWALFPLAAWRNIVSTKESVTRIREMARRGNTVRPEDMNEIQLKRHELEMEGREIVLSLEEHERFDYMAEQLRWTEDALSEKMRALSRGHAIRFCLLIFTIIFTIGLAVMFGFRPIVYGSAATLYLTATCIKTTCLYTQLQERALWSFTQIIARPNAWIWRRAFWFLD
jgi:hypothetical protein